MTMTDSFSAPADTSPPQAAADAPRLTSFLLESIEGALALVLRLEGPADLALRSYFRSNEKLGRRDRGVIAETAFDILRNRRRYSHFAEGLRGSLTRRLMVLSLAARFGEQVLAAFGLPPESLLAVRRLLSADPSSLSQAVRLSLPDWLHAELLDQLTRQGEADPVDALEKLGQVLLGPASFDLRVNLIKTDRKALMSALTAQGIAAEALAEPATAVRLVGKPAIERLDIFEKGWFEVQDAGSQQLVEFAEPRRGQTVVDFCAGAGGKTLAMAAAMRSTGQIYACDVSGARLQRLKPRLSRSGASNVQPFGIDTENDPKLKRLAARADLVLVDAPCSGTGTLRRNPELKWRMQPTSVDELSVVQSSILRAAARLVKPGGALVYATCSLLERENEAVAAAFSQANPDFGAPVFLHLRPEITETDGFFAARWIRAAKRGV